MADKTYATALGFVQFPVDERDANGLTVRDATIRTPGTEDTGGGVLIRLTLWPEFAGTQIEQGDFVAADGAVDVRQVGDKEYVNMNVAKIVVFPGEKKLERGVTNAKKPASRAASKF